MNNDLSDFLKNINVKFRDLDNYKSVFIHRSYLNENKKLNLEHNERLEFLGDAVLELIVTEHLYKNYNNPEGELTNWRSAIVKGEMLSVIAKKLNLGNYLLMSRGEEKSGGKNSNLLLANTLEALIGAVYLDVGYTAACRFVSNNLIVELSKIIESGKYVDDKSKFQELIQEKENVTPTYKVLEEFGPDHNKVFRVGVLINNKKISEGTGQSKRKAEQDAAAHALKLINNKTL